MINLSRLSQYCNMSMKSRYTNKSIRLFLYIFFKIHFLFYSGLRFGESVTLLWKNRELESGNVKVIYTLMTRSWKY